MGGVGNAGGKAKNILGASGAGAFVIDGALTTSPSLMTIGPGAAPGRIMGPGGGLWLSLMTKLGDGPAGMTTGGNLPDFEGNWTINGPGAGPGAITRGPGAGTDSDVVTVGAGVFGGMGGGREGSGAREGMPVNPGNKDGIRANNFNNSGLIPGGKPGRVVVAQDGGGNGNRGSGGGINGSAGGKYGGGPGNAHPGQAASTLKRTIFINILLYYYYVYNILYYVISYLGRANYCYG